MSKAKFIDGRGYPPYCVLYTDELISSEVMALPNAALQIWLLLNMACNKRDADVERAFYMSWDRLIGASGLSRASVGRGLKKLEEEGLIHRKRRGLGKQNILVLNRPPSLIGKTQAATTGSHERASSSQSRMESGAPLSKEAPETTEGSSGDTLNICLNTSSPNGVQGRARARRPKNEPLYKRIGGHDTVYEAQAITIEDMDLAVECWHHTIAIAARREPSIWDDIAELYRRQPVQFVAELNRLTGEDAATIEMMMKAPGFLDVLLGDKCG